MIDRDLADGLLRAIRAARESWRQSSACHNSPSTLAA